MHSLACQRCGTRVLVAKYSPAHTSVQWTEASGRVCRELTEARTVDPTAYLMRCTALDEAVDAAVAAGDVPESHRVEPVMPPLPSEDGVAAR